MYRLLEGKFFASMDDELKTVTSEEFKGLSPGLPAPKGAIMLGPLPDYLKALLCLVQRRADAVAEAKGFTLIDDFDDEDLEPYTSFYAMALAAEFAVTPDFNVDYDDRFNVYKFRPETMSPDSNAGSSTTLQ